MQKGVSAAEFKNRFGLDIKELFSTQLDKFISLDLMEEKNGYYSLTDNGIDVSNSVMCEFMV